MKINSVNTVSLGEVLKYEQPTKYIVDNTNYDDEFDIPVLTAGKSFLLGYTNETHNVFSNVPVIIFDDFTTAFKYVDFPFKVKSSAMKILKANKEIADIRFLYYRMLKTGIDTELHKRYWISKYSKVKIPLPPLDQQKKIAAILDAADEYKQKTKALIEKYDELTQSLFLDMFGDPVGNPKGLPTEQLGNLCDFYSGRAWKKGELGDKGYKLVRISNLHKPSFPYWLYDGEMIEKHKVEQGDLLFSWAGVQASIDAYIYEGEVAMINQHIYNIKPKRSDINKLYLFNLLQLHLENLRKSLGGGVGQFHLKKSDITSIKALIPDSNSMEKYMQSLNSIKNQKAKAQESLAKAEDLFNSLLQKAFKGELTN